MFHSSVFLFPATLHDEEIPVWHNVRHNHFIWSWFQTRTCPLSSAISTRTAGTAPKDNFTPENRGWSERERECMYACPANQFSFSFTCRKEQHINTDS